MPSLHLRLISALVLFFFTWTLGGVSGLAHAAQQVVKQEQATAQKSRKGEAAEEKLGRITEELTASLADQKTDLSVRKKKLTAYRAELNKLDPEIRKQFAETEKKLKDAKLPAEILARHTNFVKQYDTRLAELKGSIERVEQAKGDTEVKAELEKTGKQLEQVKAPSRHHKLDPNNLPHRQPRAIKREPRTKKEQFDQDLKKDKHAWKNAKRIMVASGGSLAGLLTPDELAETAEVQLTPEIKAKALELGNNPVRIYEWVRNNIAFTPTWGSIQGAQMTMLTRQGNAFDTASLLIALLRAAGIHAHYVTGTIELPIDKAMNWAGNFTDPNAALNFMASGGIPVTGLRSGGKVVAARMEHIWVEAFINYIPSRGAKHSNGKGDTWISLDASFKKYNYSGGIDFRTAVPFDGLGFAAQLKATASVNDQEGYATNVSSSAIQTALSDYNTRLQNYVSQNHPNATVGDILGKQEIIKKEYPYLLGTLPYKTAVKGASFASIPASYQHKLSFDVKKEATAIDYSTFDPDAPTTDASLTFTRSLPELAGKRVTLSFDPATPADKAIIDTYVAQRATTLPAYMIQVVPNLRIDNVIVATGTPVSMGAEQPLTITVSTLNNSYQVTHNLNAGDYTAIGLNPSKINLDLLQSRIDKNDFSEPVGEMLHQTALSYWGEVDAFNEVIAKTVGVNSLRHPSELAVTAKISLSLLWGIRAYGTYKSRNIDVKLDNQSVMAKVSDSAKEYTYMQQSGANSSFLEGAVFDQLFGKNIGDSISAVNAMKLANDQGIPIYGINASNIATTLPKLQVSQEIRDEVANAVNAGLVVQIPKTNISHLGWNGIGYIIANPVDGTAAYRISGGLNGGDSPAEGETVMPLPHIPINAPSLFVIGGLATNSGFVLQTEAGSLTGVVAVAPGAAVLIAGAEVMALILLLILIVSAIKYITDKIPTKYVQYRHYTTYEGVLGIWKDKCINESSWWVDTDFKFPGVYLTDLLIDPSTLANRNYIATTLRIPPTNPDPSRVVSYVEILIDIYRVLLISAPIIYEHQYLYPTIITNKICHDGSKIIFDGHGPLPPLIP